MLLTRKCKKINLDFSFETEKTKISIQLRLVFLNLFGLGFVIKLNYIKWKVQIFLFLLHNHGSVTLLKYFLS